MQELAVVVIVSFAALYLGAKYMPLGLRARVVNYLTRDGRASRLAKWLGRQGGGACGGGGSCSGGGCAPAAPTAPTRHRVFKLHQKH
jgi:hypothetical protein